MIACNNFIHNDNMSNEVVNEMRSCKQKKSQRETKTLKAIISIMLDASCCVIVVGG